MCFIIAKFHCEVHSLPCCSWQEENYQFISELNKQQKTPNNPFFLKGEHLVPYNCDKDVSTVTVKIIYIFIRLIFDKTVGSMPQ